MHELDAAHRLQRCHHRGEAPGESLGLDRPGEPLDPSRGLTLLVLADGFGCPILSAGGFLNEFAERRNRLRPPA